MNGNFFCILNQKSNLFYFEECVFIEAMITQFSLRKMQLISDFQDNYLYNCFVINNSQCYIKIYYILLNLSLFFPSSNSSFYPSLTVFLYMKFFIYFTHLKVNVFLCILSIYIYGLLSFFIYVFFINFFLK